MGGKKRSTFIAAQKELLDPLDVVVLLLEISSVVRWTPVYPPPKINNHPLALTGVESKVGCYTTAVSCSASYFS